MYVCMYACIQIVSIDGHFSGYHAGGWLRCRQRQHDPGRVDRGPKLGHHYFRALELLRYCCVANIVCSNVHTYIHRFIHTYIGSIYNSIFQSMIDIRNLSELLSETPDIIDEPGTRFIDSNMLDAYVDAY